MIVVGVSALYHDAAVALVVDGTLVAAAQEERFSRRRFDPRMPVRALNACLEDHRLTIADVDHLAWYEDPQAKLSRQLAMGLPSIPPVSRDALFRLDASRPERGVRDLLGYDGELSFTTHHEAHAASSFYCSGFEEAAVLTADAVGEWATTTYGRAGDAGVELLEEVVFPHSLGLLYSAVTSFLGFDVNSDEYKVMGLAPYGDPRFAAALGELVAYQEGGAIVLDERLLALDQEQMHGPALGEVFGVPPRAPESAVEQVHRDAAASIQQLLEQIVLAKAAHLHRLVPSENLCFAGGVALNCVVNAELRRRGPFRRIFVQPAAGDAGGAVGAALQAHHRLSGRRRRLQLVDARLGPAVDDGPLREALDAAAIDYEDHRGREEALLSETAARLAAGEVVGWAQGRMEFGPRALGGRSILADPRDGRMRDRINALVKQRESFRPFAPAVALEAAADHFELATPLPFMLETVPVRDPLALPAVTHVDGSARVQTVARDLDPRFHGLLCASGSGAGCRCC